MIQPFQPRDAESCIRIIHACLASDPSYPAFLRQKLRYTETAQSMIERARLFYVAVYRLDDQVAGVAGLDLNEIRLLYVAPERRRLGIGRSLLEHMKAMVPGTLFCDIFVYASPQAVDFYASCGFIDRGPYVFDIAGESLQTIFMTSPIDA